MDLRSFKLLTFRHFLMLTTLGAAPLIPAQTEHFEFVHIPEELSISISSNSPPRALLEDEWLKPLEVMPAQALAPKRGEIFLSPGESVLKLDIKGIQEESRRVLKILVKNNLAKQRSESRIKPVEPTSQDKTFPVSVEIQTADANKIEITPLNVIQLASNNEPVGVTHGDAVPGFGDAFKKNTIIQQGSPTYEDRALPSMPEEELDDLPVARTIPILKDPKTPYSNPVHTLVAYNSSPSRGSQNKTHTPFPDTQAGDRTPYKGFDRDTHESAYKNSLAPDEPEASKNEITQALINGTIELTQGLAVLDESQLQIFHIVANQVRERAQINLKSGRYEVLIQNPYEGDLIAQVRDGEQMLMGEFEQSLDEIEYSNSNKLARKVINIKIHPVATTVEGRVDSAYFPGQGIAEAVAEIRGLANAITVDQKGGFSKSPILHDSEVILSAAAPGHWGSVAVLDNRSPVTLQVFPDKMVQALAGIAEAETDYQNYGIVWGRVDAGGQPVEGATVEAASSEAVGPLYFNALQIPDPEMKATGPNGLFAFVKVEPGFQVIRAKYKDKLFPSKVTGVEKATVSQVSLEVAQKRKASAIIYDAFTGRPLQSEVGFSGSDKSVDVKSGLVGLKFYEGRDLLYLEAEANQEYMSANQTVSRGHSHIYFPMVKREWVESLVSSTRFNRIPQTGIVIGFVRGADYEVLPLGGADAEILYFNSEGQFVGTESGVKGGGFIAINVTTGLQSFAIAPKGKKALALKTALSDSSRVSLINYEF